MCIYVRMYILHSMHQIRLRIQYCTNTECIFTSILHLIQNTCIYIKHKYVDITV